MNDATVLYNGQTGEVSTSYRPASTPPDEVDELVVRYAMRNVFVMPQATTRDRVLAGTAALVAPAVARGYRVSTRLHILLWDNQRGW